MNTRVEQYEFDHKGRMKYNPEFHPNQGKHVTDEELEYICKFWEIDGQQSVAFALGRTETSIMNYWNKLNRAGLVGHYKRLETHYIRQKKYDKEVEFYGKAKRQIHTIDD